MSFIHDDVCALHDELIETRRWLHQHAELSFCEVETSNYIESMLRRIGGFEISRPCPTAVLAVLKTGKPGKTIALRADIDALPMQESNGLPFASLNAGVMHSCGHDGHAAVLLMTAKIAAKQMDKLKGEIRFIFQHAEETPPGGAAELIAAGVLDGVDEAFGIHFNSVFPTGTFGLRAGALTSSTDAFDVTVIGYGGHSSMPECCVDPIVTGAEIIGALQTIPSRNIRAVDPVMLSVCWVESGSAYNIIPDTFTIRGSVRTYSPEARDTVEKRIGEIAAGIAAAHGASADYKYSRGYGSVTNDAQMIRAAEAVITEAFGPRAALYIEPLMPGDDFSAYTNKVKGCFVQVGTRNEAKGLIAPHHNTSYVMDEDALPLGLAYMASMLFARANQN